MKCAKCDKEFVHQPGGLAVCEACTPDFVCRQCGQTYKLPEIVEMTGRCITCEAMHESGGPGAEAIGSVSEETQRDLELGREMQEAKGRLRGMREERTDICDWLDLLTVKLEALCSGGRDAFLVGRLAYELRLKRHKRDKYFALGMYWNKDTPEEQPLQSIPLEEPPNDG